jgi:hypothetical protein
LIADDLRKNSVTLQLDKSEWVLGPAQIKAGATLRMEEPPDAGIAAALVHTNWQSQRRLESRGSPISRKSPHAGSVLDE